MPNYQTDLAAIRIASSTTFGCDSIGTWLLSTSKVVAPIRLAAVRSRSGCTAWSLLATMYQLGLVRHPMPSHFPLNRSTAGGVAVAHTSAFSSSDRSPAKNSMPCRLQPDSTVRDLDRAERIRRGELLLFPLHRLVLVGPEGRDVDKTADTVVNSRTGNHGAPIGMTYQD